MFPKHPRKIHEIMETFRICWLWRVLDANVMTKKSTFRVSLKTLGYNGSNWLCGRLVASKSSPKLFFADGQGNQWKTEIFTVLPVTRKRREILGWAIKGEKVGIQRGANAFWAKIACGAVLTLFWCSKLILPAFLIFVTGATGGARVNFFCPV